MPGDGSGSPAHPAATGTSGAVPASTGSHRGPSHPHPVPGPLVDLRLQLSHGLSARSCQRERLAAITVRRVGADSGNESWASSPATRKSMQGNRSRDTKPEMAVRSAVHRRGIRFRVSARPQPELARTADLVLRKTRIAVFVDGCFWHGCPDHHTQPATNSRYWADKIARNVERDSETTAYLQQTGWTVLRFWEHEDPEAVADQVQQAVQAALLDRQDD